MIIKRITFNSTTILVISLHLLTIINYCSNRFLNIHHTHTRTHARARTHARTRTHTHTRIYVCTQKISTHACTRVSPESVTYTYKDCIIPTRARASFKVSITCAFVAFCSVSTPTTMLTRARCACIICCNKHW